MVNNNKTSIEIKEDVKTSLDLLKVHPRQSYSEVICKLIEDKLQNENTQ